MPIEYREIDREVFVLEYRSTFSDQEYEDALTRMERVLENARAEGRKMGAVSIGASDSQMTSKQRQRSAGWIREHATLLREACVGQAVVLPGAVQRGVLTAILWLGDYPVPIKTFESEPEATRWVRSLLAGPP